MISKNNNKTIAAGSILFIQGDQKGSKIFLIREGSFTLSHSNSQIKLHKKKLKKGDIIGFISSLTKKPHLVTVTADTDSIVTEITKEDFLDILIQKPDITLKILSAISKELSNYNQILITKEQNFIIDRPESNLYSLGKILFNNKNYHRALYVFDTYLKEYPDGNNHRWALEKHNALIKNKFKLKKKPEIEDGEMNFIQNDIIFSEFEKRDYVYIVKQGNVKIIKQMGNKEILLAFLEKGDIFGELSLILKKARNATAIAFNNCRLIPLNEENLFTLINQSPEVLHKVITSICNRIWFTLMRTEASLYFKAITKMFALLENKLLEQNVPLQSTNAHIFNFGIDVMIEMLGLSPLDAAEATDDFLIETVFDFHFGQIKIKNINDFMARSNFYKTRDQLVTSKEKKASTSMTCEDTSEVTDSHSVTSMVNEKLSNKKLSKIIDEESSKPEDKVNHYISLIKYGLTKDKLSSVISLGEMGEDASKAICDIRNLYIEENKSLRKEAIYALIKIIPDNEIYDFFKETINDSHPLLRASSIQGLKELQPYMVDETLNIFIKALKEEDDDEVITQLLLALMPIGEKAERAIPSILKYTHRLDINVRSSAIKALSIITRSEKYVTAVLDELKRMSTKDIQSSIQNEAARAITIIEKQLKK